MAEPEEPERAIAQTWTTRLSNVLAIAGVRARDFGHSYISTEHVLLGLIDEGQSISASLLVDLGVSARLREQLVQVLEAPVNPPRG